MRTMTIRLPDDQHERLRALAGRRGISINKLIEMLSSQALAEADAETRFLVRADAGDVDAGLRLLDKLDSAQRGQITQQPAR